MSSPDKHDHDDDDDNRIFITEEFAGVLLEALDDHEPCDYVNWIKRVLEDQKQRIDELKQQLRDKS